MDRYLNATEVIHLLGISRNTFDQMMKQQDGPPFFKVGRQRRWRPRDVEAWIDGRMNSARNSGAPDPAGGTY